VAPVFRGRNPNDGTAVRLDNIMRVRHLRERRREEALTVILMGG